MKKKILFTLFLLFILSTTFAQKDSTKSLTVFGFAMTDMGYNFDQVNPEYYDAMRPTRLPKYENEFGTNGNFYASIRQSRLGVEAEMLTKVGKLYTIFDFDLFGVGDNAGQTIMRIRHVYGQLGHFGAGQTESAFMDLSVFPNILEYWGPCGMVFFRNVQFRWIPILGETNLVFALEMPGASADGGIYEDRVELANVKARFSLPDLSGHYRYVNNKFGYFQLGGIIRSIKWEDTNQDTLDFTGEAVGWGLSLSTGLDLGKRILLHLQGVYGEGIENYFNDAPVDIGIQHDNNDPKSPIIGVPLPVIGFVSYLDFNWHKKFSSSIGYSTTIISNSDAQAPSAYHRGQYASLNMLYYPIEAVMVGIELQYIHRENYSDGFSSSATKVNFSFRYNFATKIYANKK